MPPTIPPELIGIILDGLHNDQHALVQCSKVSAVFHAAAQRQLYASINLSSGYAGPLNSVPHIRCRRLLRTLSCSQHLASYINELHVLNGAWTLAEPSFPRLLVLVAARGALKVFRYGYRYPSLLHTSWREFGFPLQSALSAILKCPSLHSLSLEGIMLFTFPNGLLATVPQLRHLAMRASLLMSSSSVHSEMQVPFDSSQENLQPTFLESLALYGDGVKLLGYLTKPECPLKLSRLRKLEIGNILWNNAPLIPWLLDQVLQTLEDLYWVNPRIYSHIYGTFHLGGCLLPPLTFLSRRYTIGLNQLVNVRYLTFMVVQDGLEAFIQFLDCWGFPPNVELITISLVLVPRHISLVQANIQHSPIRRLDTRLYHNAPGATVDMQVFCYKDTDPNLAHGETMISTWFPLMLDSRRFHISIRDMAALRETAQASRLLYDGNFHGERLPYL